MENEFSAPFVGIEWPLFFAIIPADFTFFDT